MDARLRGNDVTFDEAKDPGSVVGAENKCGYSSPASRDQNDMNSLLTPDF
jgi:hypothetical protein